jgi:2-dehydropantoate 2-reductase
LSTPSVAILGPGAVGGFLAGLFWRKLIQVTCVAREETADAILRSGIEIDSQTFGTFIAWPQAAARLNHPVDLLLITTKAPMLSKSIERINPRMVAQGLVVPLLNGIEHMQVLRSRFGGRVVAGSIGSVEVIRDAPNRVFHLSQSARVELAADLETYSQRLPALVRLLRGAGVDAAILESEAAVLWGKLVRLNALSCTTSACDESVGFVRSDPSWRAQLEGCVREGAAVATAEGVCISPEVVMAQIDGLPADLRTSMQHDIAAGRATELDAIAGAVVRAGNRHGLPCPAIQSLMTKIEERMASREKCLA